MADRFSKVWFDEDDRPPLSPEEVQRRLAKEREREREAPAPPPVAASVEAPQRFAAVQRRALASEAEEAARALREAAERDLAAAEARREAEEMRAKAARASAEARHLAKARRSAVGAAKRSASAQLHALSSHGTIGGYAKAPPIPEMIAAIESAGYTLEDGPCDEEEAGLTNVPRDSKGGTQLWTFSDDTGERELYLSASFYRMPSGRWETVAYISGEQAREKRTRARR